LGGAVTAARLWQRRVALPQVGAVLGAPVLVGLFGVTVVMGVLGREWGGPATLLSHTGISGTAAVAAGTSILVNNLPAAALLASGHLHHAAALLIGLNLGPNLFVTGSLAWFLWLRIARASGADPSIRQAIRLGVCIVPLSMAAALGALSLS
jgi:arsenical pump membrane protein